MDEEDRFIQGNFATNVASLIRIRLNRCTGELYCKSKEEIDAYMRGKYLLLYTNKIRFISDSFGEGSIVMESNMEWMRISTQY